MQNSLPAVLAALAVCAPAFAQELLPVDGAITFTEANRRAGLPRWLSLKYGDFDTAGPAPVIPADLQVQAADARYHVVQLAGPVTEAQKQALRARGMDVLDYVPNHAFMVRGSAEQVAASLAAGEILWSSPLHTAWRIDPMLLENPLQGRVTVLGFDGVPAARLVEQVESAGATVAEQNPVGERWLIVAAVAQRDLVALAECEDVQWVEAEGVVTPRNNQMAWTVQSGSSGQTPIWNRGLRGEGQIIGHMDGRINTSSCYFNDPSNAIGPNHRKIVYSSGSGSSSLHGTHTAGTAAGDAQPVNGSTGNRGIAYKARIAHSSNYSASVWYTRATSHRAAGATLHTNSWGNDGTTAYNSHCNAIDLFQWNFQDNLVFFAETNLSTLRNPENAKNLVAVGNGENGNAANNKCGGGVGPTADGRRKPDLFTPGCSIVSASTSGCGTSSLTGTSMACPGATGAGALVRQYFLEGYYPTGVATPANAITPSNALTKAVLINTCRDMTGVGGYPNNTEGWGRVVLDDSLFFVGDSDKLWVQDQRRSGGITTGQTRQFTVDVLSNARPFELTMCFTDYAGTVNSSNPVVNNLNLTVTAPNGVVYRGNVFSGGWSSTGGAFDAKNNLERVAVASPVPGTWTVEVTGASVPVGPCGFALAASGDLDAAAGYAAFAKFGVGCESSTVIPQPPCGEWNAFGGSLTNATTTEEWVFRVSTQVPLQLQSFELFCASVGGGAVTVPARLYAGSTPGAAPIATTTMTIGGTPGFYTATFAAPVTVSAAYYIGVDTSALDVYLAEVTAGTFNVAYKRANAGAPWAVQVTRPSYRVLCAPEYKVPELDNTGLPQLGGTFDVELSEAPGVAFALLVQGLSDQVYSGGPLPSTLPTTQGCDLLVSPDVTETLITSAAGATSRSVSIPNSASLTGLEVFYQWVVLDSAANAIGLVTSDAGRARIGQ